jgi:hypothetical protein
MILGVALVGFNLIGASAVIAPPAIAADNIITVGIGGGGIAFGYGDGYWDRGHQWHSWENKDAADRYRWKNAGSACKLMLGKCHTRKANALRQLVLGVRDGTALFGAS